MPDRDKVIKALEKGIATAEAVEGDFVYITKGEARKALELLKGQGIPRCRECSHWQKAVRPDVGDEFPDTGYCGLFEREYLATDFCSYHTDAYWGWADGKAVKRDE